MPYNPFSKKRPFEGYDPEAEGSAPTERFAEPAPPPMLRRFEPGQDLGESILNTGKNLAGAAGHVFSKLGQLRDAKVIGGGLQALGTAGSFATSPFGLPAMGTESGRAAALRAYKTEGGDTPAIWDIPAYARSLNAAREQRAEESRQVAEDPNTGLWERGIASATQAFYGAVPNLAPVKGLPPGAVSKTIGAAAEGAGALKRGLTPVERPPAPGMTRLYRGEAADTGVGPHGLLDTNTPGSPYYNDLASKDPDGRYFSPDYDTAETFEDITHDALYGSGRKTRITSLDLPAEQAQQHYLGDAEGFREHFIPGDLARQRGSIPMERPMFTALKRFRDDEAGQAQTGAASGLSAVEAVKNALRAQLKRDPSAEEIISAQTSGMFDHLWAPQPAKAAKAGHLDPAVVGEQAAKRNQAKHDLGIELDDTMAKFMAGDTSLEGKITEITNKMKRQGMTQAAIVKRMKQAGSSGDLAEASAAADINPGRATNEALATARGVDPAEAIAAVKKPRAKPATTAAGLKQQLTGTGTAPKQGLRARIAETAPEPPPAVTAEDLANAVRAPQRDALTGATKTRAQLVAEAKARLAAESGVREVVQDWPKGQGRPDEGILAKDMSTEEFLARRSNLDRGGLTPAPARGVVPEPPVQPDLTPPHKPGTLVAANTASRVTKSSGRTPTTKSPSIGTVIPGKGRVIQKASITSSPATRKQYAAPAGGSAPKTTPATSQTPAAVPPGSPTGVPPVMPGFYDNPPGPGLQQRPPQPAPKVASGRTMPAAPSVVKAGTGKPANPTSPPASAGAAAARPAAAAPATPTVAGTTAATKGMGAATSPTKKAAPGVNRPLGSAGGTAATGAPTKGKGSPLPPAGSYKLRLNKTNLQYEYINSMGTVIGSGQTAAQALKAAQQYIGGAGGAGGGGGKVGTAGAGGAGAKPPGKVSWVEELFNSSRTVQTAGDISYSIRQGFILAAGHPIEAAKAFGRQIRAFADHDYANRYAQKIMNEVNPATGKTYWERMQELDLELTSWDANLGPLEEGFLSSRLAQAPGIKHSNIAGVTFLNSMRYNVAKQVLRGAKNASDDQLRDVMRFINQATGRGTISKTGKLASVFSERNLRAMNAIFYSPRFQLSRVQVALAPGKAVLKRNPYLAKEAGRDIIAAYGAGRALIELARWNGAKVEEDETSPDWGKIQVGNTRVDIWGGFQPIARLLNQVSQGKRKSIDGQIIYLDEAGFPKGKTQSDFSKLMDKYRPEGSFEKFMTESVYGKFIRSKLAPVPGTLLDAAFDENYAGQKFDAGREIQEMYTPLGWNDIYQAWAEDYTQNPEGKGVRGAATGALSLIGAGAQTIPAGNREYPPLPTAIAGTVLGGLALNRSQPNGFAPKPEETPKPTKKPSGYRPFGG